MGDDIMLRSTSRVEQLTLEDKTVTECKIIQKSTVVTERKERLTEEVLYTSEFTEILLQFYIYMFKKI